MTAWENLFLTTPRLLLRPLDLNDVDILWPDIADIEISRFMAWEAHTDKMQTLDFIRTEIARRQSNRGMTWVILKDSVFCGIVSLIGLVHQHRNLTYNKAELAYWLSRQYWGQGIMLEAVRQVMHFGYEALGLHKIIVSHFVGNTASEKLIIRLGFRCVGEQVEEFQKNGIWYNHRNYELLAREFIG